VVSKEKARHLEPIVRRASRLELARVEALLEACGLPIDGIKEPRCEVFVVERDGRIVGSAAIEWWGDDPLLRSVAVDPALRGRAVGRALVDKALGFAKARQANVVYLLTTTAAPYFAKVGFVEAERSEAPATIRSSREFSELCPSSATFMRIQLT
jgi:amino-acid N-acetyltransferase